MFLLIIAAGVYALAADSIPASILAAGLILYRAQRPGEFMRRARDAWYAQRAAAVSAEDVRGD